MRLTVFDLDHTLLKTNCSFRFGFFLYQEKFFSSWTLLNCLLNYMRHKWLGMSIYDLHFKTFACLFKGRFLADINRYVKQFLAESLDAMLYDPVIQRLKKAQDQGDYVLILSSSPDFLVREVARCLQVSHWNATIYQSDENGKFIAIQQVMEGQDKAQYVKTLMDQLHITASAMTVYSDSHLDLPILKMAGTAIGVGPDHHLKRICLQNGWEIL